MIVTVQGYLAAYTERNPGTGLTEYVVRQIVYGDAIPFIKTGNKRLFESDHMDAYLLGKRWTPEEIERCKS